METEKQREQKWSYRDNNGYYLNLSDGVSLFVDVSSALLGYNDEKRLHINRQYIETAQFERETGDVKADIITKSMYGPKTVETKLLPKILEHKDLFLKAPGLSNPARTLAHIIFEALEWCVWENRT